MSFLFGLKIIGYIIVIVGSILHTIVPWMLIDKIPEQLQVPAEIHRKTGLFNYSTNCHLLRWGEWQNCSKYKCRKLHSPCGDINLIDKAPKFCMKCFAANSFLSNVTIKLANETVTKWTASAPEILHFNKTFEFAKLETI